MTIASVSFVTSMGSETVFVDGLPEHKMNRNIDKSKVMWTAHHSQADDQGALRIQKLPPSSPSSPRHTPADAKAGATTPGARMVYLCCRIHPLIRDSASVRKVPFHVEWWRDMTLNASQEWLARTVIIGSITGVAIILLVDLALLERNGTGSSAHEHRSLQEEDNAVSPWLPVVFITILLIRMLFDPCRALLDHVRAPNWVDGLQGSWSWRFLRLKGRTEIATTMLAVTEAEMRSHEIFNMASPVARRTQEKDQELKASLEISSGEDPLPFWCLKEEERRACGKAETQPNRETTAGHWRTAPVRIAASISSSKPQCFEGALHMSLDRVVKKSKRGSQEVYNEYFRSGHLRLGMDRVMDNDASLKLWLGTWRNCWTRRHLSPKLSMNVEEGPHASSDQMARRDTASTHMVEMLDAWKMKPCTWGPSVQHLESEISVLSTEGILMFPEHLLSTILPRYGHSTTVEEVAYLSAKGVKDDQRYYRFRVFLFWLVTAVVMRVYLALQAWTNDDAHLVAVVSLGVAGLWLNFAQSAFNLDTRAIVTGRAKEGCILEY